MIEPVLVVCGIAPVPRDAGHTLHIGGWHPARPNTLKATDRAIVSLAFRGSPIPKATGRRRVSLLITLAPRQRAGDPDCYWKSLLDALVQCGALVGDSRQLVELGAVAFDRAKGRATTIVLEDVSE